MVNWNNPTTATGYTLFPGEVRSRDENLGKMDFTSDTNIPTNFKRWNTTNLSFENYNGATWDKLIHNLTTPTIENSSITTPSSGARLYSSSNQLIARYTDGKDYYLANQFKSWSPTWGAEGAGDFINVSGTTYYARQGDKITLAIAVTGEITGTPQYVTMTPPVNFATESIGVGGAHYADSATTVDQLALWAIVSSTTIRFYTELLPNTPLWGTGTGAQVRGEITYKAAI